VSLVKGIDLEITTFFPCIIKTIFIAAGKIKGSPILHGFIALPNRQDASKMPSRLSEKLQYVVDNILLFVIQMQQHAS
jgi:hypothetical protein